MTEPTKLNDLSSFIDVDELIPDGELVEDEDDHVDDYAEFQRASKLLQAHAECLYLNGHRQKKLTDRKPWRFLHMDAKELPDATKQFRSRCRQLPPDGCTVAEDWGSALSEANPTPL